MNRLQVVELPLRLEEELANARLEELARELWDRLGVPLIGGGAAPGSWTFTNATRTKLLDGTFDIDTDSYKIALFQSTSNIGAASTTYAGVTNEVANGNGYATGGVATTLGLSGTTSVPISFTAVNWTGSGAGFSARFAVLYEVGGNVVAYALLDSAPADVTVASGVTLQINAGNIATLA